MDTGGAGPGQVEPGKANYFVVYRGDLGRGTGVGYGQGWDEDCLRFAAQSKGEFT